MRIHQTIRNLKLIKFYPPMVVLMAGFLCIISSCGEASITRSPDQKETYVEGISSAHFGTLDSQEIVQYTLANKNGMIVRILNYGGIITSIVVPDRKGQPGDVVLGFDSLSGYIQKNNPYFGALIGRYGNRIAHAQFNLDGKIARANLYAALSTLGPGTQKSFVARDRFNAEWTARSGL